MCQDSVWPPPITPDHPPNSQSLTSFANHNFSVSTLTTVKEMDYIVDEHIKGTHPPFARLMFSQRCSCFDVPWSSLIFVQLQKDFLPFFLLPKTDATLQSLFLCFITSDEKLNTKQSRNYLSRYLEIWNNLILHTVSCFLNIIFKSVINSFVEYSTQIYV